MRVEIDFDENNFKLLYKCWEDHKDLWGGADAIAVVVPPRKIGRWNNSTAFSFWFLGRKLSEALMVFTQRSLHFLSRAYEPFSLMLKNNRDMDVIVHHHVRRRGEDGGPQMLDIVKALMSEACSRVAVLLQEPVVGSVMRKWNDVLSSSQLERVDAVAGFQELFGVKSEYELENVGIAAMVSTATMAKVMDKVQRAVEERRLVTHAVLIRKAEVAIQNAQRKLNLDMVEGGTTSICSPPSLKSSGVSGLDEPLGYDGGTVITCSLGAQFEQYCSNLARTFFVDPSRFQERMYNIMVDAQEAAIDALKPGSPVSAAYRAAADMLVQEDMTILMTSCGSGMGLQFKELGLVLDMHNDKVVKPGMVFNVQLCYDGFVSRRFGAFSIVLADTVIIQPEGPEVVTAECSKDFRYVAFSFAEVLDECEPPPKRQELQARG